jgi:hypothetical protein
MNRPFFNYIFLLCLSACCFALIGSSAMAQCPTAAAPAGTGTSGDPYIIATFENLKWISENDASWGAHFRQTADIDASITSDACYNAGAGWSPVGNGSTYFTGNYDGDGNTITGLFINRPSQHFMGLFGVASSATIADLGLLGVDHTGNLYVGGMVAKANGITITNCYSSGDVFGVADVGGLAGNIETTSVSGSYSSGTVAGDNSIGGLFGFVDGTVTNCYTTAAVTAVTNVGGFAGLMSAGTITNSYATGAVLASVNFGGLVGIVFGGSVNNSFWDTNTSGQATSAGGTGKTTAQMKTLGTFTAATWDFQCETTNGTDDTWGKNTTDNGGYPFLSWQPYAHYVLPVACMPSTTSSGNFGTGIVRFQFNTIDNAHNDFNNDGTQDFTCSQVTEVVRGNTYAFTLTGYGGNSEYARIYVDYDNSGTFEVGEAVFTQNTTRQATHTGNIIIPMTGYAAGTVLRMRVMTNYNAITSGCANLSYGEAEDYGIIIPCHTPTVSSTAPATGCGTGTVVLGATPDVGTIRWYDAATAGTLLGTGTTFTTPSIAATTTYYAEALYGTCTSARTAVVATVDATCLQWTGTTDTDWNTATNWNGNTVPTASNNVLIPDVSAGSGNFPVVSTSGVEANDVTVHGGASLTIAALGDLTINGGLSNTGTVIVGAEGSGIGSLITLGAVSGAGVFQADQYLQGAGAATPSGVFQYVSSPVVGATSTTYDAEGDNKLWSASEATQTYTEITDGSTTLNVGEGYVARVGFEGAYSLTGTAFNTGNVNITGLTRSGNDVDGEYGYNLIGNPYPSSVNWDEATLSNVSTTIWYRTHTAGNVMTVDTYNALGPGIGTNNNYMGTDATGIIPPGQAFWVRVVEGETTGSVSFANTMRSHGSQASIYKQEAEEGTVRLHLSNGTVSDETIVHFTTDAEDSYDDFDSQKMWMNNLPQLYTTTGTDSLTINGLYSIETNPIVDLGIKAPTTGNYTITASSITLTEEVWLEDRLLNNFQHLNVNPVYAFTTDARQHRRPLRAAFRHDDRGNR